MSDDKKTGPRRKVSSGEFKQLTGSDGSIEFVFDEESDVGLEESSAQLDNLEETSRPQPEQGRAVNDTTAPTSSSGQRRILLIALAFASIGCIAVAAAVFAASDDPASSAADEEMAAEEGAGFRPYSGNGEAPPPAKEEPEAPKDEELPEELAGWEFNDSDDEVIVIEESHPEAEEQGGNEVAPPGSARVLVGEEAKNVELNKTVTKEELLERRRPTPVQRQMLRKLNKDLDAGKYDNFKIENQPSRIPAQLDPKALERLRSGDVGNGNIPAPSEQ